LQNIKYIQINLNKMTDKKTDTIESPLQSDLMNENLKTRLRGKMPEGVDFSSIGSIDLSEAEKIATEEIVFLTEEDLIEGLEDFELIPLKSSEPSMEEKNNPAKSLSPGLRIKTISAADNDEKAADIPDDDAVQTKERGDEVPAPEHTELKEEIVMGRERNDERELMSDSDPAIIESQKPDRTSSAAESTPLEDAESETGSETDYKQRDAAGSEESVEISDIPEPDSDDRTGSESSVKESSGITEDSVNIQLEDIFYQVKAGDDPLPQRFKTNYPMQKAVFIDDAQVSGGTTGVLVSAKDDPLTDRLTRVIHASDASMTVITEKSDYYDDHTYLMEDMSFYEKKDMGLAESEEIFHVDPDLDFFENAIIKNDFSRFIQEIDDYYDVVKIESESQISEILGINSEERELIEKDLFAGYYSNIDFESEIDFLNPDLDFINRVFVQNKEVSYLIDKPDSLFDEERTSIEDDITSRSAIVFEEDVEDLKLLMQRDYGVTADFDKVPIKPVLEVTEPAAAEIDKEYLQDDNKALPSEKNNDIINITDKVIILDDRAGVNAFAGKFPDKEEDLVKLFSYLDGLFEKLPEETIKKFAESEYFDLYVKVMNEIGA